MIILILNYYPVSKKNYCKIEQKNRICINVFSYEFEDCIDLLLIPDENKLHYVYIKGCNRFMCNKIKNKNKKHFCKYSGKIHNISTYPFLFIIRRFEWYYTHCQETALN